MLGQPAPLSLQAVTFINGFPEVFFGYRAYLEHKYVGQKSPELLLEILVNFKFLLNAAF